MEVAGNAFDSIDGEGRPGPVLLGTLLRIPYSAVSDAVEQRLVAAGHGEIRRPHLSVLQPLFTRQKGARLTDLATWAHITKPSMTYLVHHLERHAYVERSADPTDGRSQQVRITERGIDVIGIVRSAVLATEDVWAEHLGRDRLELLRGLLRDLAMGIGSPGMELG